MPTIQRPANGTPRTIKIMSGELAVLAGVVAGGVITFLTQINIDRNRIRREHITSTYAELCSVLAERALGNSKAARDAARVQIAALSARIAIYGNQKVADLLADFIKDKVSSKDEPERLAAVVEAMREHVGEGEIDSDSITTLIRGNAKQSDRGCRRKRLSRP